MRHELPPRRHVDAVDVGETDWGSRRAKGHLAGACRPSHLNDLFGGRASNDRIIDDQHIFAEELTAQGIQLLPDRFLALRLPRHDESATDVAILEEPLA